MLFYNSNVFGEFIMKHSINALIVDQRSMPLRFLLGSRVPQEPCIQSIFCALL